MKKVLILFALLLAVRVSAQQELMGPIPTDTAYRIGKLSNGMTYYIRHNEKPKGQADFYILHDVGAIQESDAQQGLAHFLEHMAFNGTKNLPGKMITEYLEKVGVSFGANLNASTSWDETTYKIKDVPTSREGIIDTALLILHDWSRFITLDPKEIDDERGVISEELRTRDGASWRSTIKYIKTIGRGTKYEQRNLIGSLDGLKNFKHEELVDFYHQWYRPDYQAIVVVGDIDVDQIEAKIKTLMADIPAPAADASKKETIVVPGNTEPIVSIFTDPEMQSTVAKLYIKRAAFPKQMNNTGPKVVINVLMTFMTSMQNDRFAEMSMKPNAKFLGASMGVGGIGMIPSLETTMFGVQTVDGKLAEGFEAVCTEMERMRRYGFTQSEFDRVKEDLMRSCERSYLSRGDRRNNGFVQSCISHYQDNTPLPTPEYTWKLDSTVLNLVNLKMVNDLAKQLIVPENRVITVTAPQKEGVTTPTAEELIAIMAKVTTDEMSAHEDNVVREPLIAEGTVFKGSKVKNTENDALYGTTVWTLANGVKIIIKPTTFKADEIRMSASADGGTSMLEDADYFTGKLVESVSGFSGVSKFSALDLGKQLTGKVASAGISVNEYSGGLGAACSPKDLETMLQLVWLRFMQPRYDKGDYDTMMKMVRSQLENAKADPSYELQERFTKLVYGDSFRSQMITTELLDKEISYEKLPELYKKLFPGVRDYKFIFVGNIDLEILRPLVEKYIGSLPVQKKAPKYVDRGIRPVTGKHTEDFRTAMQQPKVSVFFYLSGEMKHTLKNSVAMSFLTEALNSRYQVSVREEKGGTYGVSASGSISRLPREAFTMQVSFDTNEQMADELSEIILKEIEEIAANGPKSEDIEKTREYLLKSWKNSLEQNGSWMSYIHNRERYGLNYLTDYEPTIKNLSAADVQELAKQILASGNQVKMVMRPEVKAEVAPAAEAAPAAPAEAK